MTAATQRAAGPVKTGGMRLTQGGHGRSDMTFWPWPYPGESDHHFAVRVTRRYRDMPEAYHLHRIHWQITGHTTFRPVKIKRGVRSQAFTAALRRVCKSLQIYYPRLFWAVCHELGTRDDLSPHQHFLIASVPRHVDLERFRQLFTAYWRRQTGGICRVLLYDRELGGAAYVAKYTGTNCHGNDCGPTLSEALLKYLKRLVKERGAPSTRTQKFCDE